MDEPETYPVKVTIGLPVYNAERYLDEALGSILGQDFSDFELIASDNASSDRTYAILESWEKRDPRLVVHRNERNLGGAANFNRVLALARGEYFRWAGHDDLIAPGMVGACVKRLDAEDRDCVLVYPQTVIIDEHGVDQAIFDNRLDLYHDDPVARLRHLIRNFRLANVIFGLMRTEAIRAVGGIPRYNSGDVVMIAGMALRGRFSEIPEPLFYRRIHGGMSRKASKSLEGFATWFDPTRRPLVVFPLWRVWREMFHEIRRSPLEPAEKVRASAVLAYEWPRRHWLRLQHELRRAPGVALRRHRSRRANPDHDPQ